MVKPTIHPEGGLKKEGGFFKDEDVKQGKETSLPAFAVIPLRTDIPPKDDKPMDASVSVVARPRKLGIGICISMLLIMLLIIGVAFAMFIGHVSGKQYTFRCGVGYGDDYIDDDLYPEKDYMNGENPFPDHTLNEDVEVDPYEGYERIEVPEQDQCERLTILHDFTMNMTAYRLWRSQLCYITWLDIDIVLGPREFIEKAEENPNFLSDYYATVYETYWAVLPELSSLEYGFGYYIPILCSETDSYWIEKIPESELDEYWEKTLADQFPGGTDDPSPESEHRRRRAAVKDSYKDEDSFDKVRAFSGKGLAEIKIYKPEFVSAKKALEKLDT